MKYIDLPIPCLLIDKTEDVPLIWLVIQDSDGDLFEYGLHNDALNDLSDYADEDVPTYHIIYPLKDLCLKIT